MPPEMKKLTVRVDERWLESAKLYASRHGTSLSKLIGEYLRELTSDDDAKTPTLQRLSGILPVDASLKTYGEHLNSKYDATA